MNASSYNLISLTGEAGVFFVFGDVSLCADGCFRLRFSLFDLSLPPGSNTPLPAANAPGEGAILLGSGMQRSCLHSILSDPFIVYPTKKFPVGVCAIAIAVAVRGGRYVFDALAY